MRLFNFNLLNKMIIRFLLLILVINTCPLLDGKGNNVEEFYRYMKVNIGSYFPIKERKIIKDGETYHVITKDERIIRCRNGIVNDVKEGENLTAFLNGEKLNPEFRSHLTKKASSIRKVFGLSDVESEKFSLIASTAIDWGTGMDLLRKAYKITSDMDFKVQISSLEDAVFIIFWRITTPTFWDYFWSGKEKINREKRLLSAYMEAAIAYYIAYFTHRSVDEIKDPLEECERLFCHTGMLEDTASFNSSESEDEELLQLEQAKSGHEKFK